MIEFLKWLKNNHWHVYKDGTWYTMLARDYTMGKPRRFYTEKQVVELFSNELPI
jgi:hypothetical protein